MEALEEENGGNVISDSSDSPKLSEMAAIASSSGSQLSNALLAETPTGPFHEEDLSSFLRWPEYSQWSGFLKLNNKTFLNKFIFNLLYFKNK